MKKYTLYVCLPMAKYHEQLKAEEMVIQSGRINFYVSKKMTASYPSNYTVVESIKPLEDDK